MALLAVPGPDRPAAEVDASPNTVRLGRAELSTRVGLGAGVADGEGPEVLLPVDAVLGEPVGVDPSATSGQGELRSSMPGVGACHTELCTESA